MNTRAKRVLLVLAGISLLAMTAFSGQVQAQAASQTGEKWIHVRVVDTGKATEKGDKGETVRVNVPLSLAEAILPAVKADRLQNGKVRISDLDRHGHIEEVDLRAIWEAVRKAPDNEFVTVESSRENVRVAKQAGYLVVNVRETRDGVEKNKVDVKVPLSVVEALLSGGKDELDLLAAIRALAKHGDTELVTVKERNQTVRVWIDSKSTAE